MQADAMNRRRLIVSGAALGLGIVAIGCGEKPEARTAHDEKDEKEKGEKPGEEGEDVTPAEDLMREHGALNRTLLIYEECGRRLEAGAPGPAIDVLGAAAGLIRRFIEEYHEKLEEEHLFPRFEKANKLVDLVAVLRRQHEAGRRLTEQIQKLSTPAAAEAGKKDILAAIRSFVRMYRPHEAREDTVLFPALHDIMKPRELEELGERFEDKEHQLFGKEGFEGIVEQIGKLEQQLGIHDLAMFTPT